MTTAEAAPAAQCIVCGGTDIEPFYSGLLKCRSCAYVFANLTLSDEELFDLYRRNYFFGEEYADYLADRRVMQKNFELRMRVLDRFIDPRRHRHVLEIGSAYGFFLDLIKHRFESVRGIDISEDGVAYARDTLGLDVRQGDLLTADFGGFRPDVVCLWDTIEHLRSPHLYLEKVSAMTDSGALIAITTGDIESVNARIQRNKWRLIHPPTHAHYFSKKTIERILDKYGFDVVYNRHGGFYRSVDNAAYILCVLQKKAPWLYPIITKSGLGARDFYLNLFDIMYVVARKR